MEGLVRQRPLGKDGALVSLADLGYSDAGLDSGWQMCGAGVNGSYHNTSGQVIIDYTRFPSLAAMTAYAHALGLTAGWYLNCDGCEGETKLTSTHYVSDSEQAAAFGFDGVKFDDQAGGPNHNITLWAEAINATKRSMMIENCLNKDPKFLLTDPVHCPFNFYRSSPDNGPSFYASMSNIGWTLPFLNVTEPVPASRPGCYAYPDMLTIGSPVAGTAGWHEARSRNCSMLTPAEERTLFSAWAVVSAPLVLGFDVSNESEVARLWPLVGNTRALDLNAQWAGEAGRLLKTGGSTFTTDFFYGARCEAERSDTFTDWIVLSKRLTQPAGGVAVLIASQAKTAAVDVSLTLDELLAAAGPAADGVTAFAGEDVWTGAKVGQVTAAKPFEAKALAVHDSVFVIFHPAP